MSNAVAIQFEDSVSTGRHVTGNHFGANALHTVNLDEGTDFAPSEGFSTAIEALEINHLRYPGGHVENTINVFELEDGKIRHEVGAFLDWCAESSALGVQQNVTFVLPTKTDIPAADVEAFVYLLLRDYGDIIHAIEIGNEYSIGQSDPSWDRSVHPEELLSDHLPAQTEEEYAAAATNIIEATDNAIRALNAEFGSSIDPAILIQMSDPSGGGSSFKGTGDYGSANAAIIDGLSDRALDAVDGVVAHYYYNAPHSNDYAFQNDWQETRRLEERFDDFLEQSGRDLELYVTEWNVQTSNEGNLGAASGSTLLEMFEFMVQLGVDDAHIWPLQHRTANAIAGTREAADIDLSFSGAIFSLMSSSLRPLESVTGHIDNMESLISNWSGSTGEIEVNHFSSAYRQVLFVSSRYLGTTDLDIDLSFLPDDARITSINHVSIDPTTADGLSDFADEDGLNRTRRRYIDESELDLLRTLPFFDETDSNHLFIDSNGNLRTYLPSFQTIIPIVDHPTSIEDYYFAGEADARPMLTSLFLEAGSSSLSTTLLPFDVVQIEIDKVRVQEGDASGEVLRGGYGRDVILGRDGDDTIHGGESDDTLKGGWGDDRIEGSIGDDWIVGGSGADIAFGGEGTDRLEGEAGRDTLFGGSGNDLLSGGEDDDLLSGDEGNDTLDGGDGADLLFGGAGADRIHGGAQSDTLGGGAGGDVLDGGDGWDQIWGGAGNDLGRGGSGNDTLGGGAGMDTLHGGAGDDLLWGGHDADLLYGDDGADVLGGFTGDDTLHGGAGDDAVWGDAGDDLLHGDAGADTLGGGDGDDVLWGGTDADSFVFSAGHGNDRIMDFETGIDRIDLSGLSLRFGDLTIDQNGADAVLRLADGNIRLMAVQVGTLDAADFIF